MSGHGLHGNGAVSGHGLHGNGAVSGHGLHGNGAVSGHGLHGNGAVSGHGLHGNGAVSGHGLHGNGAVSGHGLHGNGAVSGHGLHGNGAVSGRGLHGWMVGGGGWRRMMYCITQRATAGGGRAGHRVGDHPLSRDKHVHASVSHVNDKVTQFPVPPMCFSSVMERGDGN